MGFPPSICPRFRAFLRAFSLWMVNTEDDARTAEVPGQEEPDRRSP